MCALPQEVVVQSRAKYHFLLRRWKLVQAHDLAFGKDSMMRLLNQEKGFSIIEGLVAQVVLILVALATWSVFVAGSRFNAEAEDRNIAANIDKNKVEELMKTT